MEKKHRETDYFLPLVARKSLGFAFTLARAGPLEPHPARNSTMSPLHHRAVGGMAGRGRRCSVKCPSYLVQASSASRSGVIYQISAYTRQAAPNRCHAQANKFRGHAKERKKVGHRHHRYDAGATCFLGVCFSLLNTHCQRHVDRMLDAHLSSYPRPLLIDSSCRAKPTTTEIPRHILHIQVRIIRLLCGDRLITRSR